jgi:phosphoketolase
MAGALRTLDTGPDHTRFLGFRNRGGTLDVFGMLFANGCTWGHIVAAAVGAISRTPDDLPTRQDLDVVNG